MGRRCCPGRGVLCSQPCRSPPAPTPPNLVSFIKTKLVSDLKKKKKWKIKPKRLEKMVSR